MIENLPIRVECTRAAQAGAFGGTLRIIGLHDLVEGEDITLHIQDTEEEVVQKTAVVEEGEEGVVAYVIAEGDFPKPGTYYLQLEQITDTERILSPVIPWVIFKSLV